ncbi:MAG: hypothetical protein JOZ58_13835 [Acetobacteraceae bacterium]|nr:hypothetical protein [Acetobacteraceae bacterium]
MRVKTGDALYIEAPARAESAESVVTSDYYTQLPQIRLAGNLTGRSVQPVTTAKVMLDLAVLQKKRGCFKDELKDLTDR